jgi:hypothetical protein
MRHLLLVPPNLGDTGISTAGEAIVAVLDRVLLSDNPGAARDHALPSLVDEAQ